MARTAVVSRVREAWYQATGRASVAESLRQERAQVAHLEEAFADLEARLSEPGWQHLIAAAEREFSREGLTRITAACRVMAIKNPLIRRGLRLRQAYVHGQGVSISARDGDVNEVVQAFWSDRANRRALTGAGAMQSLEQSLGTDGNVHLALFTSPLTGRVQVRYLPWDEITDVITNPQDTSEHWFYQREWWSEDRDQRSGSIITRREIAFYPALGHTPLARPAMMRGTTGQVGRIYWDAPTVHVCVNALTGWKFGLPDAYAAIDWAAAYREFLTDWARLMKSLSRFVWRVSTKGTRGSQVRTKIASGPTTDPYTGEPRHAGATAVTTEGTALEAIPKSGATMDSESGRPLAAMVAAALDVPVTMLLGDPGTTGARATAETLDRPTELTMGSRRQVWTEVLSDITQHVIAEAVRAPQGKLRGTITMQDGREVVEVTGDDGSRDTTVDITWPDLDDVEVSTLIEAIVKADATGRVPEQVIARLLLEALGVSDVDGILDQLTDDQGRWIGTAPDVAAAALDALDRGDLPASLLPPTYRPATGDDPDEDASSEGGNQEEDPEPAGQVPPVRRVQPRRATRAQRRR